VRKITVACKSRFFVCDMIAQGIKEYLPFSDEDQTYSVREWAVQPRETIKEELTQFLAAVKSGTPVPITGEDGLEVLKTFEVILGADG